MWRNYLKIAYRNLLKNKVYSFINIAGLGMGIACCALIFMYVKDELAYDDFHEKGDRIYRVVHGYTNTKEEATLEHLAPEDYQVWGNAPVGPALKKDFRGIEKIVQFSGESDILLRKGEKQFQEDGVFFMDSTFFDVFSFDLLRGDAQTALKEPYSIVMTEKAARKYFGNADPIGQTLEGDYSAGRSDEGTYKVTGILADFPENSHLQFEVLISLSTFYESRPIVFEQYGYVDFYTYFLVNDDFDPVSFQDQVPDFIARNNQEDEQGYTLKIEPLSQMYLESAAVRQPGKTGSMSNIYIFSIIGLFILVIAIINFMNLSTARSMERAKEVGIRRTIGAVKKSLVFQFLGESMIIVVISTLLAIVLISLLLPVVSGLTEKSLALSLIFNWKTLPVFIISMLLIGIVSGSYPAFVLSNFKPAEVLKGTNNSKMGGTSLRKGLVVFQFTLSIILITGTIVVYSQMVHILDRSKGFDQDRMLLVDYNYDEAVNSKLDVFKEKIENLPHVKSMAAGRSVPGAYYPWAGTGIERKDGTVEYKGQPIFEVNIDYIPHMGLEMVAGRAYSRDFPADSAHSLVINESAAKQYGYTNPEEIIGKKFAQWGKEGRIIGVVKDFNFVSLHKNIEPLTLRLEPYSCRYLIIKTGSEGLESTITSVEDIWKDVAPHRPFLYSFLDEEFNKQYKADFRFRKLFTIFSVLAIFISCLGLLGLATYTAKIRTKEIGIRKVMGADVQNIMSLLSKDFIRLVLFALLLAIPVSWYAMSEWLQSFAYRVSISWWMFAFSGLLAVAVAVFTISFQSIKVALMNPVKAIKDE